MTDPFLQVNTESLTGAAFEPFIRYVHGIRMDTESDIDAIGSLVPERRAEIDDYVTDLEKQAVPLVLGVIIAAENLPRGDAATVEELAAILESVEENNITESSSVLGDGGTRP